MELLPMNWFQKNILNVDKSLRWRWNEEKDGRKVDRTVSLLERFFKKYIGSTWSYNGIRVICFKPFIFNKHRTVLMWGKDEIFGYEYREILGFEFNPGNHIGRK